MYLLPAQDDIMQDLRGKNYFAVFNANRFYNQFLLHPSSQDKFIFVSERGLEKPHIVLMGYRNSPAFT